jgi:hypothetical protein
MRVFGAPCPAKTSPELISSLFKVFGLHAFDMKILLVVLIIQSLNLLAFTWFNREVWVRILALSQQHNIIQAEVGEASTTVREYMVKRRPGREDSQAWHNFLKNQAEAIESCDLFMQPTIGFRDLCIFVVTEFIRGYNHRRVVSDCQIQPLDKGCIQFEGILGVAQCLFKSPCNADHGSLFNLGTAIVPAGFNDLAIQTRRPQYTADNFYMKGKPIRGNEREPFYIQSAGDISEESERVSIARLPTTVEGQSRDQTSIAANIQISCPSLLYDHSRDFNEKLTCPKDRNPGCSALDSL